jgi:hypothetical protein
MPATDADARRECRQALMANDAGFLRPMMARPDYTKAFITARN